MKHNVSSPDKRTVDGIVFDSIVEMEHYLSLKALQQNGKISGLQYEPQFVFIVNGIEVGSYRPDFTFIDSYSKVRVQDVKGWKRSGKTGKLLPRVDRGFSVTCALMLACFNLEVEVV